MKNKPGDKNRLKLNTFFLLIVIFLLFSSYSEASKRRSVKVKADESISFLCFKIYGRFNPEMTKQFVKINPHIKDWDNLAEGEEINLFSKKEMNSIVPEQKRETVVITFLKPPVIIKKDTKGPHKKALLNMILDCKDRIEVKGTAYDLKLKRDQSTIIKVFEGEVEIYNPLQKMPESGIITDFKKPHRVQGPHRITEKEWNEILLRQYQQVIVTKEGISAPISFDHEAERRTEWIKWNEERDLRLSGKEIL
ncbi:MAG: hypothetical protein JRF08_01560 [Deltaproteobacteria bacterium]|nr:hypothetical protein [Deltaproteobacteria bacterium]